MLASEKVLASLAVNTYLYGTWDEEVLTSLEAKHANAAAACMDSHTLAPREAIHWYYTSVSLQHSCCLASLEV